MKKLVIGILAHVDAGKTTLSEGMLYKSGTIRKVGRVDNKDAFFDNYDLEKARGITIFSKQAVLEYCDTHMCFLDTPGHVDFSAEMERTLLILDYAILVISGADGVQGHTHTLWDLLRKYKIPVFIFINKMDQDTADKKSLLAELQDSLDSGCIEFGTQQLAAGSKNEFFESLALTDEGLLETYLETGRIPIEAIKKQIKERNIFPCFFGSALKLEGIEELLIGIDEYTIPPDYGDAFGARVFKIVRDEQGNRLTHMKITGGSLKVKTLITNKPEDLGQEEAFDQQDIWEEKVNQIRIYSGAKYETVNSAEAGCTCAVTGLSRTYAGQGLGMESTLVRPLLQPVLIYRLDLPAECDAGRMLPKLYQLEEEHPELHIVWHEDLQEIQAHIMGEVQIEILKKLIEERFGVEVSFGTGNIVYKETIKNTVEGVGHFEPLRHYAEVHLLLEPGAPGSGVQFAAQCSEEVLDKNWQSLVLTHLSEKQHKGVLTGSELTDIKITLAAGRAHQKHTEGGDFRQATYRAVRQGLMQAESVLLEPYYDFTLEVPENMIGRAMSDIERMHGTFELSQSGKGKAALKGTAPVVTMRGYYNEMAAYTKSYGRLFCSLRGYEPCHNSSEVIEQIGYEPERDTENPSGSVFCSHGSGFTVSWNQVKEYMHLETVLPASIPLEKQKATSVRQSFYEEWIDEEEVEAILSQAYGANKRLSSEGKNRSEKKVLKASASVQKHSPKRTPPRQEYLVVDGYNVIFAWKELKNIAKENLDGARYRLLDILCNYQAIIRCELIVVFDAYKVKNHMEEMMEYHNIHVVYTKTAETADHYIERFAYENEHKYNITVATSDALEQIIITGKGCRLLSARELFDEVKRTSEQLHSDYRDRQQKDRNYLLDLNSEEATGHIETLRRKEEDNDDK